MNTYTHIPVLLKEVITLLNPQVGQRFVDATLGGGGYTRALLEKVLPGGRVLSIDMDAAAIEHHRLSGLPAESIVAHGNFRDLDTILEKHDFYEIDGIVADIGLSSYQLDASGRGITFQKKEPLDMRFDLSSQDPDARFILNHHTEDDLARIFSDYGEERSAKRIARRIVQSRVQQQIHYTTDLTDIIQQALPKPIQHTWKDVSRRVFQALRIAVNHELDSLEVFLPKALDLVKPGGKIVIVSFHSLEDRIVKQFFAEAARGCICPKEFPICKCGQTPRATILNRKPIMAEDAEQETNRRSIPAKLRAIEKIK